MILLGDQIYADNLNVVGNVAQTSEQYYRRYRGAFSQPHMRFLMSRVSTLMTLDDHEIEDNWPRGSHAHWRALNGVSGELKFKNAMHAFACYQACHGFGGRFVGGFLYSMPSRLWYTAQYGCAELFVMDTRSERRVGASEVPGSYTIVSSAQLSELKQWLETRPADAVKLVCCGSLVFPDHVSDPLGDDSWSGGASQRDDLLSFIRGKKIARVVFVSGDVHCSFVAALYDKNSDVSLPLCWQIAASPFHALPLVGHTKAKQFNATVRGSHEHKRTPLFGCDFARVEWLDDVVSVDNCAMLTCTSRGIDVEFVLRKEGDEENVSGRKCKIMF